MMISTRGRYALRVLTDLAQHTDSGYVPMKDIAQRQGISLKYLERILPVLSKNGIIEGLPGKGGGYRLAKSPAECTVGDILRLTEGDLAPVVCLETEAAPCDRLQECPTYPLWVELYELINDFFDRKTLADITKTARLSEF
mgnify:FL=1